jgi:hypothetical protein
MSTISCCTCFHLGRSLWRMFVWRVLRRQMTLMCWRSRYRASLHYKQNDTESKLEVKHLQVADEAVYKCEITYIEVREGCTVVQFINLTALSKFRFVTALVSSSAFQFCWGNVIPPTSSWHSNMQEFQWWALISGFFIYFLQIYNLPYK